MRDHFEAEDYFARQRRQQKERMAEYERYQQGREIASLNASLSREQSEREAANEEISELYDQIEEQGKEIAELKAKLDELLKEKKP